MPEDHDVRLSGREAWVTREVLNKSSLEPRSLGMSMARVLTDRDC